MSRLIPQGLLSISLCLLSFLACNQRAHEKDPDDTASFRPYAPELGVLHIIQNVAYPSKLEFTLFDDTKRNELATVPPSADNRLVFPDSIPTNEVYFLRISGRSSADDGGMAWSEMIPLFFEQGHELTLEGQPYSGYESISKMKFAFQGGGAEQDFLNQWQRAMEDKDAELDNQITMTINIGSTSVTEERAAPINRDEAKAKVTKAFIEQKKPLISSLFLISSRNDHRSALDLYQGMYDDAPEDVRHSKYGIDLARRIARIHSRVQHFDPAEMLAARNTSFHPFDVADYDQYEYLLLSIWASWSQEAIDQFQKVDELMETVDSSKVALIHLSMDDRYRPWKTANDQNKLDHSYMLRGEARQKLIDSLYLTELPRYLLIQPDGKVVHDDILLDELPNAIGAP